jgi:hypothetical protein
MHGDDQVRFCGQCSKYVYNLSAMTGQEAESLILQREGTMCVRFYRRADGTVLTADCPVGWRAFQRKLEIVGSAAVALVVAVLGALTVGALGETGRNDNVDGRPLDAARRVYDWLFSEPKCVMGKPAPPVVVAPNQ